MQDRAQCTGSYCSLGVCFLTLTHSLLSLSMTVTPSLDPVLCLPDELLLKIFSFLQSSDLCQTALVSRQWSVIASSPWLWRTADISVNSQSKNISKITQGY